MQSKAMMISFLVLICIAVGWRVHEMNPPIEYKAHTVAQGETLWEIAERSDLVSSDKANVHDVIALMEEVQSIDSDISPGEVLLVPYLK